MAGSATVRGGGGGGWQRWAPAAAVVWSLVYAALGVFGTSLTPLPYAKAVSAVFDRHRGLALGISMAGYGVGAAGIPALVGWLLVSIGWRMTYAVLALIARPELFARLREEPGFASKVVEETLRYDAPVQMILRRATAKTELSAMAPYGLAGALEERRDVPGALRLYEVGPDEPEEMDRE